MGCGCDKTSTSTRPAAPAPVIADRRAVCRACPDAIPCQHNPAKFCVCRVCNCQLRIKTTLAAESCPAGKWSAI